jgi:hypothetical protein
MGNKSLIGVSVAMIKSGVDLIDVMDEPAHAASARSCSRVAKPHNH